MSALKPLLFAIIVALAGPALAGEPMPKTGLLRLGSTGINCVTAPCPWRGIVVLDLSGDPVGAPLWSGDELPPLLGTPADRQRLHASWASFGCLVLDGQFDGTTLTVTHITGPC